MSLFKHLKIPKCPDILLSKIASKTDQDHVSKLYEYINSISYSKVKHALFEFSGDFMVKILKSYFLATILMLFAFNAHASNFTGNVNFFLGQKSLKSSDWSPMENQAAFAVLVDFKQNNWPVSIAIDTLGSYKESTISGIRVEGSTGELDFGIRKIWEASETPMRPYVGGGVAFIHAKLQGSYLYTVSDTDTGVGYWLNGGIYWTLTPQFNLGMDLRYSQAKVTLFGVSGEAGGTSVGVIAGYHW